MFNQKYQQIFGAQPKSILHIGANEGQEVDFYAKQGITAVHIEAIPKLFEKLQEKCAEYENQLALWGCCSDKTGQNIVFNVSSSNGIFSSMLEFSDILEEYPDANYTSTIALVTTTVDDLIENNVSQAAFEMVVIDIQGAELLALKGAHQLLSNTSLRALVIEVAHQESYKGGASVLDILNFLEKYDFFLHHVNFNKSGWGNAFFIRKWWGKNSTLSQNMLGNFKKNEANRIKNVLLSSNQLKNSSTQSITTALNSGSKKVAFQTKKESSPYIIIEFEKNLLDTDAFAIFNCKGHLSQRGASLKVEYSSNGINWEPIENISFRQEFIKAMGPMLCSCKNQFKFLRLSLTEENSLQLTKIVLLKSEAVVTD